MLKCVVFLHVVKEKSIRVYLTLLNVEQTKRRYSSDAFSKNSYSLYLQLWSSSRELEIDEIRNKTLDLTY